MAKKLILAHKKPKILAEFGGPIKKEPRATFWPLLLHHHSMSLARKPDQTKKTKEGTIFEISHEGLIVISQAPHF